MTYQYAISPDIIVNTFSMGKEKYSFLQQLCAQNFEQALVWFAFFEHIVDICGAYIADPCTGLTMPIIQQFITFVCLAFSWSLIFLLYYYKAQLIYLFDRNAVINLSFVTSLKSSAFEFW